MRGTAVGDTVKYLLDESEMPTQWYNIIPDLPEPPLPRCIQEHISRWAPLTWLLSFRWH